MINIKNNAEIEIMREGGLITSGALKAVLKEVKPGISTLELDRVAEIYIKDHGATSSFKTVDNYPYTTCINVNKGIVHGMPNKYVIKEGDILSIDLGALYKGFHTDLSYTLEIGTSNETSFLDIGKRALNKAIKICKSGKKIGDISYAIQDTVQSAGYTASEMLVGHGIGRELHESPYVPCTGRPNSGPVIKVGMVFAVEVIYQKGLPDLYESDDGWTLETADGSLSALFEKTVAITESGPLVLTEF